MSTKTTSKKKQATAARIIKAIADSDGHISLAAEKIGLHRTTISGYIKDFPEVAKAVEDAKEMMYDVAESELYKKIRAGDLGAIIFFLKTQCKHRGYIEKQEVEIPKDIVLRVVYDDSGGSKSN